MQNPLLNLAAINAISDPYNAIIIETINQNNRASLKKLKTATNLSNEGLRKQLEKLQKYCVIKGEITDPEDGSYSFYCLTKLGKDLRSLLLEFLDKTHEIKPAPISDSFVIDEKTFKHILNTVKLDGLKRIFDHSKIILTDHDYSELKQSSYEQDDEKLENFLNDEKQVIISSTYNDEVSSTKIDYYLRRAKKLSSYESRLVVSSIDEKASLVSDNIKVQSAARSLGVMCANSDAVIELNDGDYLWEKFYELSLKNSDAKNLALTVPNNPLATLKKNYNKF